MWRIIIGIGVLILLLGAAFGFIRGGGSQAAQAQPTAASLAPEGSGIVVSEAQVVPAQKAGLAIAQGGIVAEVLVKEGDHVKAGQALVRLASAQQEAVVARSEAELTAAAASYDRVRAGASPADVAAAEALVQQRQGQLQQVNSQVTAADIRAAEARLQEAQARLDKLRRSAGSSEVEREQDALKEAQARLETVRAQLSANKTRAQSSMDQAANTLRDRQAEYSRIGWENKQIAEDTRKELAQERKDIEAAALRAVENADQALKQAQVAYEEAKQAEITGIAAAEAQVSSAQSRVNQLRAGAGADELAGARAEVASAQAELERLRKGTQEGALHSAQAALDEANANLDKVRAGPAASDLAVAQAQQQVAQAALKVAQVALQERTLLAPFDGVVAELNVAPGEFAAADRIVAYLADLQAFQVETTRLTELDVVRVKEGDPATVTFDAIPDLKLAGKIARIKPLGQNKQGDILYTVIVALNQQDARLRWNMTATVTVDK